MPRSVYNSVITTIISSTIRPSKNSILPINVLKLL